GAECTFEQQLISWRRELHQNPELSLQEVATTARLHSLRLLAQAHYGKEGAECTFEQQLISWRRELHQNPELSLQEVATTAR
ncbi:hypothetical protein CK247_30290, partial [Klebsiella pneumoniae]